MKRVVLIAAGLLGALAIAAPSAAVAAPSVAGVWSNNVGSTTAELRAELDTLGLPTTYQFEYTPEAKFLSSGFNGAVKAPSNPAVTNGGQVLQRLTGLQAATTYRFRLIATSGTTFTGKAHSLTTDEVGVIFSLPDQRGWEMVSPVDKNGGEIQSFGGNHGGGVLQAAANGETVTYTSATSFANPVGSPSASQYLSTRTGSGWATANITVPGLSGSYPDSAVSGVPYQLFSGDLLTGLVSNGRRCRTPASNQCPVENPPLPGSGAPSGFRNYYVRNGTGAFKALLTASDLGSLALGPADFELYFAGASPDLANVVVSTCAALTADAVEVVGTEGECDTEKQNLYEKSGSTLKLINLLPGDSVGTSGASLAGPATAVSANGSRVYWTEGTSLYLREGAVTHQVDEALGGGGQFEIASADGSVAYVSKGGQLWRYDASSSNLTNIVASGLEGVLGASADGGSVYYQTAEGIFLNRGGTATPVAEQGDAVNLPASTGAARVSEDGTALVFVSSAHEVTPYDNRNASNGLREPEVYRFSLAGGSDGNLTCLSCRPSGERPAGGASLPGASRNGTAAFTAHSYKPRALIGSGQRVFFDTVDSLVAQDTNGKQDVYQWEAAGIGNCAKTAGCVNLISNGRSEQGASFVDASGSGADAFFLTDASLVGVDPGAVDLYDARIGGGFPPPPSGSPCFGDACQPLPAEPEDPTPGTLRSRPSGNLTPSKTRGLKCPKGKVKKKGRCVKKKKRHHGGKRRAHK